MIDLVDQRLKAWTGRVLGEVPVSLAAPDPRSVENGVCLYLLELGSLPPPRTEKRPPLQLAACYLVTVGAESPERAHFLLGELAFAAMDEKDFEVDLTPVPVAVWTGLGVLPRPSFRLRVPVRRERAMPAVPRVRLPLVAHALPISDSLAGVVVGPGDVPVPGALVELPSLRLSTRTDARGTFRFPSVPPASTLGRLEVRARGEVLALGAEALATEGSPLVIRLPLKEE
ncbi:carboxypeptidase regulatory-like domain-containing protein [Myxococcaceae bacterium GXIMD 01537]